MKQEVQALKLAKRSEILPQDVQVFHAHKKQSSTRVVTLSNRIEQN